MEAAPSITDALQNNPNYTQSSALTLDGNAVSAGNAESQSWAAHTLNASYTFDGVTMNGSETYHVTGLPFISNPPTTTFWKKKEGTVDWENNYVRLGNWSTKQPHSIRSNNFHIVESIPIRLYEKVDIHRASVGNEFTLLIGSNTLIRESCDKNWYSDKTVENSKETTVTTNDNYIICSNSYGSGNTHVKVYYIKLYYR